MTLKKSFPASLRNRWLAVSVLACAALAACQSPPPPPPPPVAYTGPTLPIEQTERGVEIFLPGTVLFAPGKADFNASAAAPYLERVAFLLKNKTQHQVSIEGHTDGDGTQALNQKLSEQRAESVRADMVARGVPADRLTTVGYSFNRPRASNATEEGKRLNRRVEIIILDEKVENITRGEPQSSFASAFAQLKQMMEQGLIKPAEGGK